MLRNFVIETASAPGTAATINLAGAITGRRSFAQAFSSGAGCYYFMDDGTQAEWGKGTFTAGSPNTLTRSTVIGNTSGTTSRLNFAGTTRVYNEAPAEGLLFLDATGNVASAGAITAAYLYSTGNLQVDGNLLAAFLRSSGNTEVDGILTVNATPASAAFAGSISATAFNVVSDRRLKTLFGPADGAEIARLQVVDAEYKATPGRRRPMLIADQLQDAGAGYAVHGEKGAVDEHGAIAPQMVDHSTLLPATIAYAQSLKRELVALEQRVAALEARITAPETK